jgi:mannose-6-phosphate isomerase-like protein (cupin superfamily)
MAITDIGPNPQAFDLESATLENPNYRTVAWSGEYLQVTLMSIPVGGDIGLEKHGETDQFIRLDRGRGRAQMGPAKGELTFDQDVTDGWCVIVPAGTWHNVTNVGDEAMQVYTVYAPQHHTPGKVQPTKAIADSDTDDAPADWSVQPDPVADQHV